MTCLLSAGCGSHEPEPLKGPAKEVAAVVEALQSSLQARDYRRICRNLLSSKLRDRAGGGGCPAELRRTAADVRRPRIRIRKISVKGPRAKVEVTTRAKGELARAETIELVREGGRFRISSLSR